MDYFQGVVTEYLRSKRTQFVNTEYMINLDLDGTYAKGRHWYCDAVAIDFEESRVYLCEVTYAKNLHALLGRLAAWNANWRALVDAVRRDSALKGEWHVVPRVFIPQDLKGLLEDRLKTLRLDPANAGTMPLPVVTSLEDVLPWKYRSWNGKAFVSDDRPLSEPPAVGGAGLS